MECKGFERNWQHLRDIVLIETLWNVKNVIFCDPDPNRAVLIETLWNVKCKQLTRYQFGFTY